MNKHVWMGSVKELRVHLPISKPNISLHVTLPDFTGFLVSCPESLFLFENFNTIDYAFPLSDFKQKKNTSYYLE